MPPPDAAALDAAPLTVPTGEPARRAPARPIAAAPGGGLATDDAPPLHLPGAHFALALTALVLGAAGLVWGAPEIARGEMFAPHVLAIVHLFTLGWITTSILGALCQFLPVAVGTPIRSQGAAYLTLMLHGAGLALFVGGLLAGSAVVFRTGAILVVVALASFALNLALTLARSTQRDVTFWALVLADTFLIATLTLGALLAWNLHTGAVLGAARIEWLAVHVHVALAGWVLMVMVGVAHRLLPMFLLSHGASERPAQAAITLLALGSALLVLPLCHGGLQHTWIAGGTCIALGVGAFLAQAASFARHRRRRAIDPGMKLALAGLGWLAVTVIVAPFAVGHGFGEPRLLVAYVFLAIVAAISTFVAGHYYKIVPFLVWYHRFGPLVGERPVPKVADLFSARAAGATVALFTVGTGVMLAGLAFASAGVVRAGAILFAAAVVAEAAQMALVARRRPA